MPHRRAPRKPQKDRILRFLQRDMGTLEPQLFARLGMLVGALLAAMALVGRVEELAFGERYSARVDPSTLALGCVLWIGCSWWRERDLRMAVIVTALADLGVVGGSLLAVSGTTRIYQGWQAGAGPDAFDLAVAAGALALASLSARFASGLGWEAGGD